MSALPKTSMIIPCYFADQSFIDMTQRCLDSLQYGRPDEVIVVDDGSPDYEDFGLDVDHWLYLPKNLGFPGAVNVGLARAKHDILIISNNDIEFAPYWIEELLKPLALGYDISSIVTSDQGWETRDEITEGDRFGSLWAMKRKVYETLGGLDERFGKGTFEDTDYYRRALAAGFRIGKNHRGFVEHIGRATFDVVDPVRENFLKNREVYRDKWGEID